MSCLVSRPDETDGVSTSNHGRSGIGDHDFGVLAEASSSAGPDGAKGFDDNGGEF